MTQAGFGQCRARLFSSEAPLAAAVTCAAGYGSHVVARHKPQSHSVGGQLTALRAPNELLLTNRPSRKEAPETEHATRVGFQRRIAEWSLPPSFLTAAGNVIFEEQPQR